MLYPIIGTQWMPILVYIFIAVFLLFLFCYLIFVCKVYLNKERKIREKRKSKIRNLKIKIKSQRRIKNCLLFCTILSFGILVLLWYTKKEYQIVEHFYGTDVFDKNSNDLKADIFEKSEREYEHKMNWADSAVHMDWYWEIVGTENKDIDSDDINEYCDKVEEKYKEMPYKEDLYLDVESDDEEEYSEMYAIFNNAVNSDISNWKSDDLWEAYIAGKKLLKNNNTSEMVFQTGVLAEGAHENVYKESRGNDDTRLYIAAATEEFDDFISFIDRNSGNGVIVSEVEICFRQSKMDYREGLKEKDDENLEAQHFFLKAYSENVYATEHTSLEDKMYLTYLYYRGLSFLGLISYMKDDESRSALCAAEIELWDAFLEKHDGDIGEQTVENKTKDDILEVKIRIEQYVTEQSENKE